MIRFKVGVVLAFLTAVLLVAPKAEAVYYEFRVAQNYSAGWIPDECSALNVGYYYTSSGVKIDYGRTCIVRNGDYLVVVDMVSDGHRVGMQWRYTYSSGQRNGVCMNITGGSGNMDRACDASFGTAKFEYRTGRCNGSETDCNVISNWKNWSSWKTTTT